MRATNQTVGDHPNARMRRLGHWAGLLAGGWVGLVTLSLLYIGHLSSATGRALALTEARASYDKDLVYRRWATMHGGVYVPPTTNTPPNPYLEVPHRDVVTTSGQSLTLVNPAYMTRQVHALGERQYGVRGHITSLKPIRPANAADAWETNALRAFEAGVKETNSLATLDGQLYLRFMRPMTVEAGCLKCHAKQGYREGEIRGGISVSVPMAPYQAILRAEMIPVGVAHAILGGLGLAGIGWARWRLQRHLSEREALHERFRLFYEHAPVAYHALDAEGRIVEVNSAWLAMLGYEGAAVVGRSFGDLLPSAQVAHFQEHLRLLAAQGALRGIEYSLRAKQGAVIHVVCDCQTEHRGEEHSLRTHCILHNITERKQMEAALLRSDRHLKTILAAALDGFALTDLEGRLLEANEGLRRMLGYSREELLQRAIKDFEARESAADIAAHIARIVQQGSDRFASRLRCRDGREIEVEVSASYFDADGGRFVVFVRDTTERNRVEAGLHQSELKFSKAFQNAPVMMTISHLADGVFVDVNEAFVAVSGYSRAEAIGHSSVALGWLGEETRRRLVEQLRQHGRVSNLELTMRAKNGQAVDCIYCGEQVTIDGRPCLLSIALDVTGRKELISSLVESEARFRQIVELSSAAYFRIGCDGCFQQVNGAWLAIHGFAAPEEIIGRHFSVTQTEEGAPRAVDIVDRVLAGEVISSGEFTRRRRDGSVGYHTFSVWPMRRAGRIEGVEGFLIDTSDLHQVQANYQMLFNQMLDGFAVHEIICNEAGTPVDYRFLAVNPAFERLTGLSAEDLIGRTLSAVLPGEDPAWVETYGRVALTGEPVVFERESPELGRVYQVSAFRPAAGQFACIFSDITERWRLEAQLRQAQKMEAVGQLAGGVAHDFNNILAAILLNLGLLRSNSGLDPQSRDNLGEMEAEAKRAANLTRQLLMFSRRSKLQVQQLDLNEVVVNVLKMLGRLIGEHIDLQFAPGTGLPAVSADPGMMEQILMNLAVNARDAMSKGGRLLIATEQVEVTEEEARLSHDRRAGLFVRLTVTDTGCGMDAATLKRIFEPFFTTKEAGKGTGLGLATVYGIVAQHKGWIEVASQPGRGATFHVFLPASTSAAALGVEDGPIRILDGRETILLVEDEVSVCRTVARALEARGYTVLEANNGQEALALWQKDGGRIDLLLSDMVMPEGMNGLELAERLRALKPGLKVILSSGYIGELSQEGIPTESGYMFLPKPYDTAELAKIVRECLDRR